jgi:polyisoprenoid-binding protein YceI
MTRILRALSALLLTAGLARLGTAADLYQVDKAHSRVGFSVSHMMISSVEGNFKDYQLELKVDPADLAKSSVKAVIQTASINTENEKRDEHLRSDDFFDAAQFPTITFTSKKIEQRGKQWVALGDFSMRGVSKPIELPFTLGGPIVDPWGNTRLALRTRVTLNRQDYGVSWSKSMDGGGFVVGDEVEVSIVLEATKQ